MAYSGEKIHLILGSYAHVPYGAPDQEFESAYENILPFVSNLYKYPRIQAALHYSGVLLYWIERSHSEFLMLIEDMVSRRQIELLGGGFYEPMLPLLPLQDKIGQIELFTTYLRKHFGKRPLGCWIPGLAWEQNLTGPLSSCGMGYTFLAEEQFAQAGLKPNELYWPCLAEDQGKLITVFPIFHSLEKELAEKNAQAVFKKLHNRLTEGEGQASGARQPCGAGPTVAVFPPKIFSNPGEAADYAWNRFFEELTLSESVVESIVPSKIYRGSGKLKRASFPDSPPDSACAGGAPPRSFLIACPEANGIYSKMMLTNLLINHLRGDKARKLNAREEQWKAQGYSLFSSPDALYRHGLRKAAYRSLISAEQITREKTKFVPSALQLDFDFDGINEYLFQDQKLNCYIQAMGASVFELDYLPRSWNYLDTCNYYGEALPVQGKAAGSSPSRIPCRRAAFADNFFPADTDYQLLIDDAAPGVSGVSGVSGGRCCAADYYSVNEPEKHKGKVVFFLPPDRTIPFGAVSIEKTYSLKRDTLTVSYALCNHGGAGIAFQFATEIELSFPGEGSGFIRLFNCKTGAKDAALTEPLIRGAECIKIQDIKNEVQIILTSANSFDACVKHRYIPLNGTSIYQSSAIMPIFTLNLESGQSWANEFSLKFSH